VELVVVQLEKNVFLLTVNGNQVRYPCVSSWSVLFRTWGSLWRQEMSIRLRLQDPWRNHLQNRRRTCSREYNSADQGLQSYPQTSISQESLPSNAWL